ncbi:MAG: hypothetical protein ACK4ZN_09755 [Oceanibaculum sp.]
MPVASRILVALLLLALAAPPAAAQEDADGPDGSADAGQADGPVNLAVIEAVTYGTIPPGSRLVTQPETQGEMDDAAWRLANDDLAARGYQIGNDGALVLTVATQLVDRISTDQANTGPGPNSAVAEGMQFSTAQQTLLNPSQPINRRDRIFRVAVTVYDRTSGGFVWRGSAERVDADTEPSAALRAMLPALLDHIGENASGVAVPLRP